MNSGFEAVDTAILIARRWGYKVKNITYPKATILFASNCYWGTLTSARAGCDDPKRREGYEPFATESLRFDFVEFNDIVALETKFKDDPTICAYLFEPVQGAAGNIHPDEGYYTKVRELCDKYNILMVADEVQVGLGRCGKLLCCDWENVKPDLVTLGKSLSGGFMPISAVLGNNKVMDVLEFGDHHSTYAANPLAMAITKAAVDVLFEDNLIEKSEKLGEIVAEELRGYHYSFLKDIQCGKGLFASIQFGDQLACWTVCQKMLEAGILVKPEMGNRIKIMPPLCITPQELSEGLLILKQALDDYDSKGKFNLLS